MSTYNKIQKSKWNIPDILDRILKSDVGNNNNNNKGFNSNNLIFNPLWF